MLLEPLRRALERRGFRAVNWRYRSLRGSIEPHAARLAVRAKEFDYDTGVERLHFVGHSMGAIVVRRFSAAKTRSSGSARAPKSRCSAGGPGTTALRAASRGRDRTLLASRQLREQARASSGSRLRCHRGVVGPRCLTCIDAPARPTRSLDSSQPAHAPAAPPHARASGALFARRLLCPRRIDAGES